MTEKIWATVYLVLFLATHALALMVGPDPNYTPPTGTDLAGCVLLGTGWFAGAGLSVFILLAPARPHTGGRQ